MSTSSTEAKHMDLLLGYLEERYMGTDQRLLEVKEQRIVPYDLIWAIFKPNSIAITHSDDSLHDERCFVVDDASIETEYGKEGNAQKERYVVRVRYKAIGGAQLTWSGIKFYIDRYEGTKPIQKLSTYPLELSKKDDEIRKILIERGKRLVDLLQPQGSVCWYDYVAIIDVAEGTQASFTGRVVVDPVSHRSNNKEGVK